MKSNITLYTVLGWEERFLLSTNHILENYDIDNVCLICFTDYIHMNNMDKNSKAIKELLQEKNIQLNIIELEYRSSISNWKNLDSLFSKVENQKAIINITTFPRETIWTFLFFLRLRTSSLTYVYYKPERYDNRGGGLTKNHKNPRLLFKHSGIFDINKKLALFIITGFDQNRTDLLIEYYEPTKIVFLSQKGKQFENMKRNCGICPKTAHENVEIENISFDSYDIKESYRIMDKLIKANSNYNIIITSQGPKTSAISTYLAYLENKSVALAYVPAREFSGQYSFGFDKEAIVGKIKD